jgi:hypothetical protein
MASYMNSLAPDALVRYKAKLAALGLEICPYEHPDSAWTSDPKEWPDVEYPDIYHYLIETPSWN